MIQAILYIYILYVHSFWMNWSSCNLILTDRHMKKKTKKHQNEPCFHEEIIPSTGFPQATWRKLDPKIYLPENYLAGRLLEIPTMNESMYGWTLWKKMGDFGPASHSFIFGNCTSQKFTSQRPQRSTCRQLLGRRHGLLRRTRRGPKWAKRFGERSRDSWQVRPWKIDGKGRPALLSYWGL